MQITTLIIGKHIVFYTHTGNDKQVLTSLSILIIAPTFFTAGIYVLLGHYIKLLGRKSSILSPNLYLWIFCTCDIVSLVIQAVGGGMAATATNKVGGDTKPGTDIMVAGIVFQLASITVFVFCAADFSRRSLRLGLLQSLSGSVVPLFGAMILSVIFVYIRSIYRTIELAQGWHGYLITREKYFIALDGAMMLPAVAVFNFFHPGWLLPNTVAPGGHTTSSATTPTIDLESERDVTSADAIHMKEGFYNNNGSDSA